MPVKFLALLSLLFSATATAADYAVIASKNTSIGKLELRQVQDIFLIKRNFINGKKIIPVNTLANDRLRQDFEDRVLKLGRDELNRYWTRQHFQGISTPVTQPSYQAVMLFVVNVPGAVGYVPRQLLSDDVELLYEF